MFTISIISLYHPILRCVHGFPQRRSYLHYQIKNGWKKKSVGKKSVGKKSVEKKSVEKKSVEKKSVEKKSRLKKKVG